MMMSVGMLWQRCGPWGLLRDMRVMGVRSPLEEEAQLPVPC